MKQIRLRGAAIASVQKDVCPRSTALHVSLIFLLSALDSARGFQAECKAQCVIPSASEESLVSIENINFEIPHSASLRSE